MFEITCKECGRTHEPLRKVIEAGWDSVYLGWWLQECYPGLTFMTACDCDEGLWSSNGVRRVIPGPVFYADFKFEFSPNVLA